VTIAVQRLDAARPLYTYIQYIDTIKKNTQSLIDASKKISLEVNIEKTKYMLLSRHQNTGQNHDMKVF
jgi:hypothetical protein